MGDVFRLLFVWERTTGIRLLDNGAQISLNPLTRENKLKCPHKITLQAVNKSLIQTYDQRLQYTEFGFETGFHPLLCFSGIREGHIGGRFLTGCLTDTNTNTQSPGPIHHVIPLCPTVANNKITLYFVNFKKNIDNITKPSFHKDTLPSPTQYISTSSPPDNSRPHRLAPEKLSVAHAEFYQMM